MSEEKSFLDEVMDDLATETKVDAATRQAELFKVQVIQIVSKLIAMLTGSFDAVVAETTDRVLRLVRLGGLAEHEDVFRRVFTERPDQYFVYSFRELWTALADRPDLQKFVGRIYFNRGMKYTPRTDVDTKDFPWVIKGALGVIDATGANKETLKGFAAKLISANSKYLSMDAHEPVRRLLLYVNESGEFRIPPVQAPAGMRIEEPANPNVLEAADGERLRQKTNNGHRKTDGKAPNFRPTPEDREASREYRAKQARLRASGHGPENRPLAKLADHVEV